jgi:GNAT superfamily N-acetyltransferase
MYTRFRTQSTHPDFEKLNMELDADLAIRNGETNEFFAQFNTVQNIQHVVLIYRNNEIAACGAFKPYNEITVEIKRMFVRPEFRGNGISKIVLQELQNWAKEIGYNKCVLETGKAMPEAIGLYHSSGFKGIPNYGQYAGVESSICFQKEI